MGLVFVGVLPTNAPSTSISAPGLSDTMEQLTNTLKTGENALSQVFGRNAFELLAEEPEQADHFNRSMSGLSASMTDALLSAYDFSPIHCLADREEVTASCSRQLWIDIHK
jgi:hypothetical protein